MDDNQKNARPLFRQLTCLPKLPLPEMEETLTKYLESLKPFVEGEKYQLLAKTIYENILTSEGVGGKLQSVIQAYAQEHINWAYDIWLQDMYLSWRIPLPINFNPGMVMPQQNFPDNDSFCLYASKVVYMILNFKQMIESNKLDMDLVSEKYRQHLCMKQYQHLFDCYRCPGIERDKWLFAPHNSSHIVVMHQNKAYKVDVLEHKQISPLSSIYGALNQITSIKNSLNTGEVTSVDHSVGYLTTGQRGKWAAFRQELLIDESNAQNLEILQTCLFVLCLDEMVEAEQNNFDESELNKDTNNHNFMGDDHFASYRSNKLFKMVMQESKQAKKYDIWPEHKRTEESMFLQANNGAGIKHNSGNRWFDKTLQVLIGKDGFYGLCYEHSCCEAIVIIRLFEYVWNEIAKSDAVVPKNYTSSCDVSLLQWTLSDTLITHIRDCAKSLQYEISRLQPYILRFRDYGKEFPKSQSCSPDGYIQMAMQLAYYKTHKNIVHTYESASLRRFIDGRVDNIRSAHMEALAWVTTMENPYTNVEEKRRYFEVAMEKQSKLINENITGYGIDNHILVMRVLGERSGYKLPLIFDDTSYMEWNYFRLSTSQIPTTEDFYMGYGPVVPDGYGCSYNPHPNNITFVITAFNDSTITDLHKYKNNLVASLREMRDMLTSTNALPLDP